MLSATCRVKRTGLLCFKCLQRHRALAHRQLQTSLVTRAYSEESQAKPKDSKDEFWDKFDRARSGLSNAASSRTPKSGPTSAHDGSPPPRHRFPTETELSFATETADSKDGVGKFEDPNLSPEIRDENATARGSYLDMENSKAASPFEGVSEYATPTAKTTRQAKSSRAFKHGLLRQAHLNIDALGQPVDALIMKNPDYAHKRPSSRKRPHTNSEMALNMQDEQTSVSPDTYSMETLLAQKDDNGMELTEQAAKNLDELRPQHTKILPRRDFEKLVALLVEGFTVAQITYYIPRSKHNKHTPQTSSYPWMQQKGAWEPLTPMDWGRVKPKQKLALHVAQSLWGIEVSEQVEGPGRMPVWLSPRILHLLAHPANPVLEGLKRDFLDESNGENITYYLKESLIVIEAPKATTNHVLEQLNMIVQSIQTRKVSSQHLEQRFLSPLYLEALGRVTKTYLAFSETAQEVEVSWTTEPDEVNGGAVEDRAAVVQRLLSPEPSTSGKITKFVLPEDVSDTVVRPVVHCRESRSMSWRDKLSTWSRFVVASPTTQALSEKPYNLAERPLLKQPPALPLGLQTQVTALFGHILHESGSPAKKLKRAKTKIATRKQQSDLATQHLVLSPVTPHPAAFTGLSGRSEITQSSEIVLNFHRTTPPPPSETDEQADVTRIQLRLAVDTVKNPVDLSHPDVFAQMELWYEFAPQVADILLPAEVVDVRLTRTHRLLLPMQDQPDLQAFIKASQLDPLVGRPRTPSRTTIHVPKTTLDVQNRKKEKKPALTDLLSPETIPIRLTFTSLEIQDTVSMPLRNDVNITYTSINADQHGGLRQEVALQACPPFEASSSARQVHLKDFQQVVEDVVLGKVFPWARGAEAMLPPQDALSPGDVEWDTNIDGNAAHDVDVASEQGSPDTELPSGKSIAQSSPEHDTAEQDSDCTTLQKDDPVNELTSTVPAEDQDVTATSVDTGPYGHSEASATTLDEEQLLDDRVPAPDSNAFMLSEDGGTAIPVPSDTTPPQPRENDEKRGDSHSDDGDPTNPWNLMRRLRG